MIVDHRDIFPSAEQKLVVDEHLNEFIIEKRYETDFVIAVNNLNIGKVERPA